MKSPHTPITRTDIVQIARECLGTPFRHEGRIVGKALDCVGLLVYIWHRMGFDPYQTGGYGRSPNPRRMREQLGEKLIVIGIGASDIGDVWHMAWRNEPQHLGVLTDVGIIQSYESAGAVVEHPLDQTWRARVRGAYRFPGVS